MSNHCRFVYIAVLGSILSLAGILLAQTPPDRTLFVNGKPAGTVTQVAGHSYIDIDTVAQITNGTVTIEPNRILLSIPTHETTSTPGPAQDQTSQLLLSKDFSRAAIGELAEMREWRGAIGTVLTYGVPVVGTWPQDYHDQVETNLAQVAVSATTAGDQDALQLLRNEFSNVAQWADGIVSAREAMDATNTVNPDYEKNDPLIAKISDCSNFLSSMLVTGVFADNASCH